MRNLITNTIIQKKDGGTTTYKGEFLPYLDIQLLVITLVFAIGLYSILRFNNNTNPKKNLQITFFSWLLFLILIWWYSLPEMIFYNLLGL